MEILIGKRLKLKNSTDESVKIVKDVKENVVFFTDNGRVDLNKLYTIFEDYTPSSSTTSDNQQTFVRNERVEPQRPVEAEFSIKSNFGGLVNQLDAFLKNPEQGLKTDQVEFSIGEPGVDDPFANLSPDTRAHAMRQMEEGKRLKDSRKTMEENDDWMRLNGFEADTTVKRVDGDKHEEELQNIQNTNMGKTPPPVNSPVTQGQEIKYQTALPKMKKVLKIKLNIVLNELIPKVEDIRAVENLFEISLVDDMAKEIAAKYLDDRQAFTDMIKTQLEAIVKPKKKVVKKQAKEDAKA